MDRQTISSRPSRSTLTRLAASCAWLALAIAPAAVVVTVVFHGGLSPAAIGDACIAGGLCWFAAGASLICTCLGNVLQAPVQGLLGGMLFRMGLPLVAILSLSQPGDWHRSAGLPGMILAVYLVALVVETALAVRMVPPVVRPAQASS